MLLLNQWAEKHRWIRAEVMGLDDNKNLSSRLREGFELVRADSGTQYPTIQEGKYKGVIGVGGEVEIPLMNGKIIKATVTDPIFYDKEGLRNNE